MNLLALIPYGQENAVTRQQLCNLTGWNDRRLRKEIKELVTDGHAVLSRSDKPGYWRSSDIDEIKRFLRECDSRSCSEAITTAKLRRTVAKTEGDYIILVRSHTRRLHADKPIEGQVTL